MASRAAAMGLSRVRHETLELGGGIRLLLSIAAPLSNSQPKLVLYVLDPEPEVFALAARVQPIERRARTPLRLARSRLGCRLLHPCVEVDGRVSCVGRRPIQPAHLQIALVRAARCVVAALPTVGA